MASDVVKGEVINSTDSAPVGNGTKGRERTPAEMKQLMKVLHLTETEIYQLDDGVPLEVIRAGQKEVEPVSVESAGAVDIAPSVSPEEDSESVTTSQMELATESTLKLEKIIRELEAVKDKSPDSEKIRWEAWSLKVQGYSADAIAEKFGRSRQLIYSYWEWCKKQLPYVKDQMEEFQQVGIARLEAQYRQLAIARARGDLFAHKVSLEIIEQQAKVLGVDKMNETPETRVTYIFPGLNMDDL